MCRIVIYFAHIWVSGMSGIEVTLMGFIWVSGMTAM